VKRTLVLALAATLFSGSITSAQHGPPADVTQLARGAERVVVATVMNVNAAFQVNEHGDELIVSRASIRVDAVLKRGPGAEETDLVVEVEGGTIGDLTLDVSDLPHLERGERAVLFLTRDRRGANVPYGRGQGILKLDSADRVKGSKLTVSEIREAVERAR
jgi:hypothetical protein